MEETTITGFQRSKFRQEQQLHAKEISLILRQRLDARESNWLELSSAELLLRFFLNTLRPYLDLLGNWLYEGVLPVFVRIDNVCNGKEFPPIIVRHTQRLSYLLPTTSMFARIPTLERRIDLMTLLQTRSVCGRT
jgi:hypothetical protein